VRKLCVENVLSGKENRYSFVIAVAKRAREISSEAEFNGEILQDKAVNLAIEDFKRKKYYILEPDLSSDSKEKHD
jgi:DNA-directed RNA polymerase subunit omega